MEHFSNPLYLCAIFPSLSDESEGNKAKQWAVHLWVTTATVDSRTVYKVHPGLLPLNVHCREGPLSFPVGVRLHSGRKGKEREQKGQCRKS